MHMLNLPARRFPQINRIAILIGAGRFGEAALNLLQIRLYSEILTTIQVGRLSLLLTVIGFLPQLFIAPTGSYVQRQATEWKVEGRLWTEMLSFEYFLWMLIPIPAVGFYFAMSLPVGTESFSYVQLLLLSIGTIVLAGTHLNFPIVLNILGHRGWFVFISNAGLFLGIAIAAILTYSGFATAETWQGGILIGYGIMVPASLWMMRYYSKDAPPKIVPVRAAGFFDRGAWNYCLPLFITALCFWLQTYGYRLAMSARLSVAIIGIFTLGFTLGSLPMVLIAKILNDYLVPSFFQKIAHADEIRKREAWAEFSAHYIAAGLIMAPVVAASAPLYARFMVAPAYWSYAWLAWFGAGAQLLAMIYSAYLQLAQGMMDNKIIVRANLAAGCAILIMTYFLAPFAPLVGPGIALVCGGLLLSVLTILALNARFHPKLPILPIITGALLGLLGGGLIMFTNFVFPSPGLMGSFGLLVMIGLYVLACLAAFLRRFPITP